MTLLSDDSERERRRALLFHILMLEPIDRATLAAHITRSLKDDELEIYHQVLALALAERAEAAERGDRAPPGTPLN